MMRHALMELFVIPAEWQATFKPMQAWMLWGQAHLLWILVGVIGLACVLKFLIWYVIYRPRRPTPPSSTWDAQFATEAEIRAFQTKAGPGLVLGRARPGGPVLYAPAEENMLVFGEPGRGKSRYNVYGSVDQWQGGVLYVDLKGNGYTMTCPRRAQLGPIAVWCPGISGLVSDHFNPLDAVRWGTRQGEIADVRRIAHLVVAPTNPPKSAEGEFYARSPRGLISLVALYSHYAPHVECSLPGMRAFMSSGTDVRVLIHQMTQVKHPYVIRGTTMLLQETDRELKQTWQAAAQWLEPWDDPSLIDTMSDTTIHWQALQFGPAPLTWYIRVAAIDMRGRLKPVVRLILDAVFAWLLSRDSTDHDYPVLVVIDDAAEIDRLEITLIIAEFGRQYGIHLLLVFQDPVQVLDIYGTQASLFGTCSTWVIHRLGFPRSAEFISEKYGERTVREPQETVSRTTGSRQRRTTTGERVTEQQILRPHEVSSLRDGEVLICSDGLKIRGLGVDWFSDPLYREVV